MRFGSHRHADLDAPDKALISDDAKLAAERTRLVGLLRGLAETLQGIPANRLVEVVPTVLPIDEVVRRIRQLGIRIEAQ